MHARNRGSTLLELVITVAILAIFLGVTISSMDGLVERQRTRAALDSLITHIALARMTAVSRRKPTILCPMTGPACNGGTDWSGGWMLLIDSNGNRKPDPGDEVVRVEREPTHRSLEVHSTRGRSLLRYLPDGRSAGSNVTISVCSGKGGLLGTVTVNNAGRARTSRPASTTPCPS